MKRTRKTKIHCSAKELVKTGFLAILAAGLAGGPGKDVLASDEGMGAEYEDFQPNLRVLRVDSVGPRSFRLTFDDDGNVVQVDPVDHELRLMRTPPGTVVDVAFGGAGSIALIAGHVSG